MFHRFVGLGIAVGVAVVLAPSALAAGSAKPVVRATPAVVSGTLPDGTVYTGRALTRKEIAARGLSEFVNAGTLTASAPTLIDSRAAVNRANALSTQAAAASGCWSYWFRYAIAGSWMWGQDDVNWCGDGKWVTYAKSKCYGGSSYPTYHYEGCTHYTNYGVGWNLYQIKDTWDFCIVYVPIWGSCVTHQYPWEQYQFLGSGSVLHNGGW